jgi:hypothetical protein
VTWTLSTATGDRTLGEVISPALRADPEAFHQVGSRRDAGPVVAAAAGLILAARALPSIVIALIPRIPRRAIDRGTRQV